MAELWKGAPAAKALTEKTAARAAVLRDRGIAPTLALVRVGAREDDLAYERAAVKRCQSCGVETRSVVLPETASTAELIAVLRELNGDGSVHGVLLFRPLPGHIDDEAVRRAQAPEKDVDGVTDGSLAGVFAGTGTGFAPCTAEAVVVLLRHYGVKLDGANAVVAGRSLVVGRPLSMLLLAAGATVTVCHSHTRDLASVTRGADIVVAAVGKRGFFGTEHFAPGQAVADVGIHAAGDGSLCGDVRTGEAAAVVAGITPVPGGVGAVTTAVLASHVVEAAERSA